MSMQKHVAFIKSIEKCLIKRLLRLLDFKIIYILMCYFKIIA
jgi:hypothetical protein